jgi:hypothetical protein
MTIDLSDRKITEANLIKACGDAWGNKQVIKVIKVASLEGLPITMKNYGRRVAYVSDFSMSPTLEVV